MSQAARVHKGDWVATRYGGRGIVRRVARDGSWADVHFRDDSGYEWSKRMQLGSLIVKTEIEITGMHGTTIVREIREP